MMQKAIVKFDGGQLNNDLPRSWLWLGWMDCGCWVMMGDSPNMLGPPQLRICCTGACRSHVGPTPPTVTSFKIIGCLGHLWLQDFGLLAACPVITTVNSPWAGWVPQMVSVTLLWPDSDWLPGKPLKTCFNSTCGNAGINESALEMPTLCFGKANFQILYANSSW